MADSNSKEDYDDSPTITGTTSPACSNQISRDRPPSSRELLQQHFQEEVGDHNVDLIVLLCWFVTGLLDGTIFNGKPTPSTTHYVLITNISP